MRLSKDELRQMLKEQLLDDRIAEITDERLLVGGLLDALLAESSDYGVQYETKAKWAILKIYQQSYDGQRKKNPHGFWKGEQGLSNARMILRTLVAQEEWIIDRTIFQRFSERWLVTKKLWRLFEQYSIYTLFITAYPEYKFDLKHPTAFHIHQWDVGRVGVWTEYLIKNAVRHTVHFHMPWGLQLREYVERFTRDFLTQENLYGVLLGRFNSNPYDLFVAGFPEYVFDPAFSNRSHVHLWDTSRTTWSDGLMKDALRHTVQYHTDWTERDLAKNITSTWLRGMGLWTLCKKFGGSSLRLVKFVYPELFKEGVLSEEHFRNISLNSGVAHFRHPLRSIPKKVRHGIKIEGGHFYFPKYGGHLVHKFSHEYGALYTADKQLIGLFRWYTDTGKSHRTIYQKDLEPVPIGLTKSRPHIAFADAVRVLADEAQIVVYDLPLKDQTALTDAFNTVKPAQVVDYLKLTGASGLRAMADTEFYHALILVHDSFDPSQFQQVVAQYNAINGKLAGISLLFTRYVASIPHGELEAFRAELRAKFFDASDRIINALSRALVYRGSDVVVTTNTFIEDVLQAQRDLLMILEVLDGFGQGNLRLVRQRSQPDGTRELQYTYNGVTPNSAEDVYLILRPRQNPRGQARIGFRIVPHSPMESALSDELSLRLDRETAVQTALDIHSDAFVRLSQLDRAQFPRGYHYELTGSEFANAAFFEKIVQSFLTPQTNRAT